jgi:uncharacterized protein YjbJ (UPF0337 family)
MGQTEAGHSTQTGKPFVVSFASRADFHVLGNARRSNTMKDSTKDQTEGKAHEVKGAVKETIGHAVNNPDLEAEGMDEKNRGKVQKKVGEVEKVLGA